MLGSSKKTFLGRSSVIFCQCYCLNVVGGLEAFCKVHFNLWKFAHVRALDYEYLGALWSGCEWTLACRKTIEALNNLKRKLETQCSLQLATTILVTTIP